MNCAGLHATDVGSYSGHGSGIFEHDFMRSSCGGDVGRGEGEMELIGCISEHQARWWKPGQNRSGAKRQIMQGLRLITDIRPLVPRYGCVMMF